MKPTWERGGVAIYLGDAVEVLRTLPDESIDCCVSSPPYWGLRDYGVDGQIGLEETPAAFVDRIVGVYAEVRRVLKSDGTCWVNLGDSYARNGGGGKGGGNRQLLHLEGKQQRCCNVPNGLKEKDLCGIPWRVAFALQADGWYLRQDIIWCLSGGTWLYARTQNGDMPIMVRDLARLDPRTVKLWNGEKWTQLLGMNRSVRCGSEIEIVLRSGERISCTPTHKFPTNRGLLSAANIAVGDKLQRVRLPEPETPRDCVLDEDAAWFAGLYIAEGSISGGTIQISGHAKEATRWERIQRIARKFGGSATITIDGNNSSIRVYGKILLAIMDELVTGRTAKDKGFATVVWRYSNRFIESMMEGYLSGDGHLDPNNDRTRLGFKRNYNLERDLRAACARLGWTLTLNPRFVRYEGQLIPSFRGEVRRTRSGHHNERCREEVVEIRKARCRYVYDLGVADDPHVFALASGILTHNSKPNPMPESVRDRCTKAHEYIFLLSKSQRYFFDFEANQEPVSGTANARGSGVNKKIKAPAGWDTGAGSHGTIHKAGRTTHKTRPKQNASFCANVVGLVEKRNRRSVWSILPEKCAEAHFATFPRKLAERCILAGCRPGGVVLDPFMGSGTVGLIAWAHGRRAIGIELNPEYLRTIAAPRLDRAMDSMALLDGIDAIQ